MNRIALLIFILSFVNNLCLSQQAAVPARFYRHKSPADRTLMSELGTLTFDDNLGQSCLKTMHTTNSKSHTNL